MVRIVGIQRHELAAGEFILLQNQGGMRINLRGTVILSDRSIASGTFAMGGHVFPDEVNIPPGAFVLLMTGDGEPKWARTKDGALVYYTYMNRSEAMWHGCDGAIHVLVPQHTYTERRETVPAR